MSSELNQLAEVTALAYEVERGRLRAFNEKEAELRRDIARLDRHKADLARLTTAEIHGARVTGSDIAWLAWHDARRLELMRRLARHLAGKEALMARLRTAYGKRMAADNLRDDAQARAGDHKARRAEMQGLAQMVMASAARPR